LGFPLNTDGTRAGLYWASLLLLILTFLLCRFVVGSKLGRVLTAIRDAESRVRFLGYSVTNYKLFAFVLSAMIAGLAGALYVPQVGIINPSEFSPANSIEAVIWVAVGGRGSLIGAVIGAFLVNGAKSWLTTTAPEYWLFILGGLFVAVTLFLPRGVYGLFGKRNGAPRVSKPRIANISAVLGTSAPKEQRP
jgi:urea transport system permease protein